MSQPTRRKLPVPILAVTSDGCETPRRLDHRGRWVRGDVRCLQCGRLLGRLPGSICTSKGDLSCPVMTFLAYRPLLPVRPIVQYRVGSQYPCSVCNGSGVLEGVEELFTYDPGRAPGQMQDEATRRRGRPQGPISLRRSTTFEEALQQIA
jgi:hypothetical protein